MSIFARMHKAFAETSEPVQATSLNYTAIKYDYKPMSSDRLAPAADADLAGEFVEESAYLTEA